jgi:hypothetical protein
MAIPAAIPGLLSSENQDKDKPMILMDGIWRAKFKNIWNVFCTDCGKLVPNQM